MSMTQRQAALLLIVAEILKNRLDEPTAKKLEDAVDAVVFELAALGIVAPDVAKP